MDLNHKMYVGSGPGASPLHLLYRVLKINASREKERKWPTAQLLAAIGSAWPVFSFPPFPMRRFVWGSGMLSHAMCQHFPTLFLPTDLGSQCTAYQPWRNMWHHTKQDFFCSTLYAKVFLPCTSRTQFHVTAQVHWSTKSLLVKCRFVYSFHPYILPRCGAWAMVWSSPRLSLNILLNVTSAAHQLPQSTRQLVLDGAQTTCNSPECILDQDERTSLQWLWCGTSENEVVGWL